MAVYRIFPEKDSFIFTEQETGNAGLDEIIEIAGYPDASGTGQTSRALVKFSTADIADVVDNKIGSTEFSSSIKMYLAYASELPTTYTIYAYPLYNTNDSEWDNGKGKFGDLPVDTSGVSWTYTKTGLTSAWPTGSIVNVTSSYQINSPGGGNWYTSSNGESMEFSQYHPFKSSNDLNINVTAAVKQIYSSSLYNNGFLLKLPNELEYNTTSSIRLKYFSSDTNTIYPPYLEFTWDDSVYQTGSLSILSSSNPVIEITNNKGEYIGEGKQRFRIKARPKYPTRTFTTSSSYLTNYALPSSSFWGLRDEFTEEMLVAFNTGSTKISCDSTGPYFDVYMDGLQPERYYRILIKTEVDGSTVVVDNKNIFKVVRNG